MAHFSVQNLTFAYPNCTQAALCQVSLDVEHGQFVVLCGKSGCGKTTLLRHLKTVLTPFGQTSGHVLFEGVPLDQVDHRTQSQQIGFVMQDPNAQVVADKVWHELAFGLESLGTDQATMRLRVAEMASYFGIQNWFDKDVCNLSGGQKQLLSLASVMAMRPSVLILDEPTSQLDPIAASDFLNTVRKINEELGTTVILTEHRLEDVFASADVVVAMDAGHVIAQGSPRAVADALYAQDHEMACALPAPLRIYYGVAHATGEAADQARAPLTVREGRTWLSRRVADCGSVGSAAGEVVVAFDQDAPNKPVPPVPGGAPAVFMKDVWMRYARTEPDVLKGCSLAIPPATTFAIVGGNGTGKTTLLKALCATVAPYRGTIEVLGKKLASYQAGELFAGRMAMVPQDPANLFATKSVREDLAEMLPPGTSAEDAQECIARVAATCAIAPLLERHPLDLSGGEAQRVALAKALMGKPRILLLDEPTKGIDNCFKRTLAAIFDQIKAEGCTIVLVSHDVEFCAHYADRVALLFDGALVAEGTPQQFFSQASFYTTAANRMSRHVFDGAVTEEDVVALCRI